MDVCARRRVTVVIDPQTDGKSTEAFVVDPVADREALYSTIVDRLVTDEGGTSLEHYEDEKDAKVEASSTTGTNV
jgi:hypothetical protein